MIGLDIGGAGVVAAEVHGDGARRTVRRLAVADLPDGAVECGDVRDDDAVVAALRRLWKQGRFPHRKVRVGVAGRQVQLRETTTPALRRPDLAKSLAFHVAADFPTGTGGLVLDLVPFERVEADDQARWRGLLVSAPETAVTQLLDVVERAGLEPTAADLSALALARSFVRSAGQAGGAVAVVDVGATSTQVVVVGDGGARLVRMVATGARAATQDMVAQLVDGVRVTLDYFRRADPQHPVVQVLLTGGGALIDGLGPYVASVVGLPVVVRDPLAELGGRNRLPAEAVALGPRAAVAIGLASVTR